jgi:hypothetical protein
MKTIGEVCIDIIDHLRGKIRRQRKKLGHQFVRLSGSIASEFIYGGHLG